MRRGLLGVKTNALPPQKTPIAHQPHHAGNTRQARQRDGGSGTTAGMTDPAEKDLTQRGEGMVHTSPAAPGRDQP